MGPDEFNHQRPGGATPGLSEGGPDTTRERSALLGYDRLDTREGAVPRAPMSLAYSGSVASSGTRANEPVSA